MRSSVSAQHRVRRGRSTAAIAAIAATVVFCLAGAGGASAAPHPSSGVKLLVALTHPTKALGAFVTQVSDPTSSHYRAYLSPAQLIKRFGASAKTKHAVLAYLRAHGLRGEIDPLGLYLTVSVPSARARTLFHFSTADATSARRGAGLTVPRALAESVTGVADANLLLGPSPRSAQGSGLSAANRLGAVPASASGTSARPRTGTPAGCAGGLAAGSAAKLAAGYPGLTPNQYLSAYGYPGLIARTRAARGERIGLVEFGGFTPSDITTFAACFALPAPRILTVPVTGRTLPPLDEAELDLEVVTAAAPRARINVYEVGTQTVLSTIAAYATPLLTPRALRPNVESISYGGCESTAPGARQAYHMIDGVFEFEAAAGISVFASAGDTGSSGCAANGNTTALPVRRAQFPASSPFVTGVGGTNVTLTAANALDSEVTWNDSPLKFGSGGGGTSIAFPRPKWQTASGTTPGARDVPDVSMLADPLPGYAIYCTVACASLGPAQTPGWQSVGGTSAAAPLLASGVADADQSSGQPPLGFVDPLLYLRRTRAAAIRDVTIGDNDLGLLIDHRPLGCCTARPGYDLATGLGSVDVSALAAQASRRYRSRPRARR